MKVDLHIHSYCSDGKYSPAKIVEYSVQNQLNIISLTDHDTIAGLVEARDAVQRYDSLKLIPGVELSTSLNGDELHILGYGIDCEHQGLLEYMATIQANRKERAQRILETLKKKGVRLEIKHVLMSGQKSSSLGRMHIALALKKYTYVQTLTEAFERYLTFEQIGKNQFTSNFLPPYRAIELILEAQGIPILAHPTIPLFDQYINTLKEAGLQGVEIFKRKKPSITEFYFETVARDKGLSFLTGGSDWHGYNNKYKLGNFYVESTKIQPFLEAVGMYE